MNVELKKVKIHEDLSDETTCFSAEIWADGERIALVQNEGCGGSNDYVVANQEKFEEYDKYCNTLPHEYDFDIIDQHVDTLLANFEEKRILTRNCKKNTLYRLKGDVAGEWRLIKAVYSPAIERELTTKHGDKIEEIANKRV